MEKPSFYHYIWPYMYTVCVCVCVCMWEGEGEGMGGGEGRENHGPYQDWASDAQLYFHTHYTYQCTVGLRVNIVTYFEWKEKWHI